MGKKVIIIYILNLPISTTFSLYIYIYNSLQAPANLEFTKNREFVEPGMLIILLLFIRK